MVKIITRGEFTITKVFDGNDGNGISQVTTYYLASALNTGITTATSGWSTTPMPPTASKRYLWLYELYKYTSKPDTYTTPRIVGVFGETGVPGPPGSDGQTTYTWVKYADTATGVGMSDSPEGKSYIGLAFNKTTQTESNTASDYTWSLMPQNIEVSSRNLILGTAKSYTFDNNTGNNLGYDDTYAYPDYHFAKGENQVKWLINNGLNADDAITISGTVKFIKHDGTSLKRNDFPDGFKMALLRFVGSGSSWQHSNSLEKNQLIDNVSTYHLSTQMLINPLDITIPGEVIPHWWHRYFPAGYSIEFTELIINKGNKNLGWTPAPEDVQAEIDRVSTGTRNLIPNSRIKQSSNEYGFATRAFTEELVAGQDYVLSVNAFVDQKTLDDERYLNVIINEPTWTHGWYSLTFNELNETIKTLTLKPSWTGQYQISFYYYPSEGIRDGLATVNWAKLEKGTRASDWSPAPEDVQAEIDNKADSSDVNGQVNDIWEGLSGKLDASEFESFKEIAEALQESYNKYIDPEAGTAYKNLKALEGRMEKIIIDLGNEVASYNFIKTYMKMGEEGFVIGQEGAPMKMILTNNRLSFVDGDKENEVAYFSGQSFYINQGAILKNLQIGTHKTTDLGNGNTVIQWTV